MVIGMGKRSSTQTARPEVEREFNHRALATRIGNASALIGIIGLGYVGLPLMLASTAKKFRVLGFDIDGKKVKRLNCGKSPLKHVADTHIAAMREAQLF